MLLLARTVRFAVNDRADSPSGPNGYAGRPPMRGLGRHYELDVVCRGEADPATGYFLDIKAIDEAARRGAIPEIERACRDAPAREASEVVVDAARGLARELPGKFWSVLWRLSPFYSVEMRAEDMTRAILRQRFEFAAAHRLHSASLSEEENRRVFGKCNHPSGHGHNYVVEPAVAVDTREAGRRFRLEDLERITDETVIARFDHKHLNLDTDEFGEGGLNPSVENIARVCFELLSGPIGSAGAELVGVTVWETEKTSATYPG
ncbi:MAG: 6-carboxytetrahydropterin synthase [Phycisphaeraceae bacterium]|nr:6-carboxytetrahydropterin synthase [Phycisphaeraceae bacterium]